VGASSNADQVVLRDRTDQAMTTVQSRLTPCHLAPHAVYSRSSTQHSHSL